MISFPLQRFHVYSEFDKHDIFVMEISEDQLFKFDFFVPLNIEDKSNNHLFKDGTSFGFFGFPITKNKFRFNIKGFNLTSLIDTLAEGNIYEMYGYDKDLHIVLPFVKEHYFNKDGRNTTFPDPNGMSGGSIWKIMDIAERAAGTPQFSFLGIIIELTEDKQYIVGVRAEYVVKAIYHLISELDKRNIKA